VEWSPESDAFGVPIEYRLGGVPFALALDVDGVPGPPLWSSGVPHSRTSLLVNAAGRSNALARSHLLVDCIDAPLDAVGSIVCTAHDGRDSFVWSIDVTGHRLVPVGRWRGYLYGWGRDGTGVIDVDANGLPSRLDLESGTLDRLDPRAGDCPSISGHAMAGRRFVAVCAREARSDVIFYDLPG